MKSKDHDTTLPAEQPDAGLPAEYDFGETVGGGFENVRAEELVTPFLMIVQPTSKCLDPRHQKYIKEAREGLFLNTLSGQLYESLEMVGIARDYLYGEWTPVDQGGGFHGTRKPEDPVVLKLLAEQGKFKPLVYGDHELIEQWNLFSLVSPTTVEPETMEAVVLAFTSTRIKPFKKWFNQARAIRYPINGQLITPPMWAHRYRVTSVPESNDQGRWYNFNFELANGPNPRDSVITRNHPVFQEAKLISEMFSKGALAADYDSAEAASGGRNDRDDDLPF